MIKSDTSHSLHGSIAMSQVHLDEDDGESYEKQAGSLRGGIYSSTASTLQPISGKQATRLDMEGPGFCRMKIDHTYR